MPRVKYKIPDINDQFTDWTVIDNTIIRTKQTPGRRIKVKCKCGVEGLVFVHDLCRGRSKRCQNCRRYAVSRSQYDGVGNLSGRQFSLIRCGANDRNIEFNITKEYLWSLYLKQDKKCALSGLSIPIPEHDFVNLKNNRKNNTASLDRIDSKIGYIEGNVQWVHTNVNFMKHNLSQTEFIELCRLIVKRNP